MVTPDLESVSFNPKVLIALRDQYLCSPSQVAKAIGITTSQYNSFENGEAEPNSPTLVKLARFFRTKEQTFYRVTLPKQYKTINFRNSLATYKGEPGPVIDAINFATQIQKLLYSVVDISESWSNIQKDRVSTNEDAEEVANTWRARLRISDEYQISSSSVTQFFMYLRSRIESLGISVIVPSIEERFIKGISIGSNDRIPMILINSYMQQKASRTFTLAHEFGHVLIGSDDVSNPYAPDGVIERFCNKFAAALLMPAPLLKTLIQTRKNPATNNAVIKWLSNKLKVSMEAVVIRLQECGIAPANFWVQWKSQFANRGRLPSEESEGGGGNADQGVVKLAGLGFLFGSTVPVRYSERGLTSMAVFKASRLKPRYFSELFEAARDRLKEVETHVIQ